MKLLYYPLFLAWIAAAVGFNVAARRASGRTRLAGNVFWGLAACAFMLLASEPQDWFYEFRIGYWSAARLVLTDPARMYGVGQWAFVNLPVVALPLLPFGALGEYQGGALFATLGAAAAAGAWLQLARLGKLDARGRWLLAGLFVLNGPLFYCLRQANATVFVLPLLAAALAALASGRAFRSGVLMAAAAVIKPPLLLLPAYYTLRGRWRMAAGAAAVGLSVAATSLLVFGVEVHRAWWECCIRPFAGRALASYTSQSVSSALARWFCCCQGDCGSAWWPVPVDGRFRALHYLLAGTLAAVTLAACLRRARREGPAAEQLDFCLVLCLALVTSPVCWIHYFLLLLLPAALLLGDVSGGPPSRARLASLALAFLAMSPPVRGWTVDRWWLALVVSHYLAGGLALMAILVAVRQRLARPVAGALPEPSPATPRAA
jgi:hypothetical protein